MPFFLFLSFSRGLFFTSIFAAIPGGSGPYFLFFVAVAKGLLYCFFLSIFFTAILSPD